MTANKRGKSRGAKVKFKKGVFNLQLATCNPLNSVN